MSPEDKQKPKKPNRWTVMLYMAATVDDQPVEPTEQAAINDLKELEKVGTTPGEGPGVNVVVHIQRRWPLLAQRYCVRQGFSELVKGFPDRELNDENLDPLFKEFSSVGNHEDHTGLCALTKTKDYDELYRLFKNRDPKVLQKFFGTGNPAVLHNFVTWAQAEFPASNYLLVLWGHAYGLGFGRDHHDPLTVPELKRALEGLDLDILGANACAMSYVEAAYELRHAAKFLVAPEIAMPFAGWPYEKILNGIIEKPDIEPQALGEKIVAEFVKSFRRQDVALTLLNLGQAEGLKELLMDLASALKLSIEAKNKGDQIADAFLDTAHGDVRPLIDLYDLCEKLNGDNKQKLNADNKPEVQDSVEAKAGDIMRKLLAPQKKLDIAQDVDVDAQVGAGFQSSEETPKPFVVLHDGDPNLEGLHGVGIYAPSLTGEMTLTRLELEEDKYKELEFAKGNEWVDFVYTRLSALLKPMNEGVLEFVKATGATRVEDRTGVAQLLLSVDRSFIKLETVVSRTQESVVSALRGPLTSPAGDRNALNPTLAAARLSRPYLRLAADFAETTYGGTPNISTALDTISRSPVEEIAKALESLEDVAANVERTVKKVLTNSTLGLGDGVGARMGKANMGKANMGKANMGKANMGKANMGKANMGKANMGKANMGTLARLTAAESDLLQPDEVSAVDLFRHAAAALKLMEEAIAEIESDVRLFLTNPPLKTKTNGHDADNKLRTDYTSRIEQVKLSFRALNEVVANARDTVFGILADPSQGLGPAPEPLFVIFDRHNLALAGGLSALDLSLL
jgi:hypothetical protein